MNPKMRRILLVYGFAHGTVELTFIPLVTICFCLCNNLEWNQSLVAFACAVFVGLLRNVSLFFGLKKILEPFLRYISVAEETLTDKELTAASKSLRTAERYYLTVFTLIWMISIPAMHALIVLLDYNLEPISLAIAVIMTLTVTFGPLGISPLIASVVRITCVTDLSQSLAQRGINERYQGRRSLIFKALWTALFVSLTSVTWLSCLVLKVDCERDRYEAVRHFQTNSVTPLLDYKTNRGLTIIESAEAQDAGTVLKRWKTELSNANFWKRVEPLVQKNKEFALLIPGHTEILRLRKIGSKTQLERIEWQHWESQGLIGFAVFFVCVLVIYCMYCALLFIFQLVKPLRDFNRFCDEYLKRGKIREMPFIPSYYSDEVGSLTATFNLILSELKHLVRQTTTVADGNLNVKVEGQGDLPNSFEQMIVSLNTTVTSVAHDSNDLNSIGHDLLVAAQNQELLSSDQYNSVFSINELTARLNSAANQVAAEIQNIAKTANDSVEGARDVLKNVSDLSQQVIGVRQAAQSIRTLAKRSRILAMNARIEASRYSKEDAQSIATLAEEARAQSEQIEEVTNKLDEWLEGINKFTEISTNSSRASQTLANSTLNAAKKVDNIMDQQLKSTRKLTGILGQTVKKIEQTQVNAEKTREVAESLVFKSNVLQKRVDTFTLANA